MRSRLSVSPGLELARTSELTVGKVLRLSARGNASRAMVDGLVGCRAVVDRAVPILRRTLWRQDTVFECVGERLAGERREARRCLGIGGVGEAEYAVRQAVSHIVYVPCKSKTSTRDMYFTETYRETTSGHSRSPERKCCSADRTGSFAT